MPRLGVLNITQSNHFANSSLYDNYQHYITYIYSLVSVVVVTADVVLVPIVVSGVLVVKGSEESISLSVHLSAHASTLRRQKALDFIDKTGDTSFTPAVVVSC